MNQNPEERAALHGAELVRAIAAGTGAAVYFTPIEGIARSSCRATLVLWKPIAWFASSWEACDHMERIAAETNRSSDAPMWYATIADGSGEVLGTASYAPNSGRDAR